LLAFIFNSLPAEAASWVAPFAGLKQDGPAFGRDGSPVGEVWDALRGVTLCRRAGAERIAVIRAWWFTGRRSLGRLRGAQHCGTQDSP